MKHDAISVQKIFFANRTSDSSVSKDAEERKAGMGQCCVSSSLSDTGIDRNIQAAAIDYDPKTEQ